MGAAVCHAVYFFCPLSFMCECSLSWVIGLVQNLWHLVHHQFLNISQPTLEYPAVVLSHGDPAAIILPDKSHHTLRQVIDRVDVGVDQLKSLNVALNDSYSDQFLFLRVRGRVSSSLSMLLNKVFQDQQRTVKTQHSPEIPTWMIPMAHHGNMGNRDQHSSQLQQDQKTQIWPLASVQTWVPPWPRLQ